MLLNQFKSPLVLILVFAAIISAIAGEWPDAVIVLAVVLGSATLGFVQEYRASDAIEKLRSKVMIKSSVVRDGQSRVVLSQFVMPGDLVLLSAGSLIPADEVVLEALPRMLVAEAAQNEPRANACILNYLDGGPSHIDLFDMRPYAPAEIRGPFTPIPTSITMARPFASTCRESRSKCTAFCRCDRCGTLRPFMTWPFIRC